ncbi:putative small VCP/p97-interacting protein [Helianthus debilis subsp. tardiflorus]
MGCLDCFDGGVARQERLEEERIASQEARAKAAEAAEKRQEQFEKSAAGRAAKAQMQAAAKQASHTNKGEPTLKWQMG